MKSAYELAMGRLEKQSPASALTDEQKQRIAEVDIRIAASIAEKKIFLEEQIFKAPPHEQHEIRRQLVSEIARLEEKREFEKQKIRSESAAA
jgi:hypothetical protein